MVNNTYNDMLNAINNDIDNYIYREKTKRFIEFLCQHYAIKLNGEQLLFINKLIPDAKCGKHIFSQKQSYDIFSKNRPFGVVVENYKIINNFPFIMDMIVSGSPSIHNVSFMFNLDDEKTRHSYVYYNLSCLKETAISYEYIKAVSCAQNITPDINHEFFEHTLINNLLYAYRDTRISRTNFEIKRWQKENLLQDNVVWKHVRYKTDKNHYYGTLGAPYVLGATIQYCMACAGPYGASKKYNKYDISHLMTDIPIERKSFLLSLKGDLCAQEENGVFDVINGKVLSIYEITRLNHVNNELEVKFIEGTENFPG